LEEAKVDGRDGHDNVLAVAIKGAVAAAAGVWLMDLVSTAMSS
jgi:hypothetical protein